MTSHDGFDHDLSSMDDSNSDDDYSGDDDSDGYWRRGIGCLAHAYMSDLSKPANSGWKLIRILQRVDARLLRFMGNEDYELEDEEQNSEEMKHRKDFDAEKTDEAGQHF